MARGRRGERPAPPIPPCAAGPMDELLSGLRVRYHLLTLSSRRPPRGPGGEGRKGPPPATADDTPAQTNLGLLLQRALQAAQQTAQEERETVKEKKAREEAEAGRETQLCANCWHAVTFKDEQGRLMARCAKDLWVKPFYTVEELNANKVRRWYAVCPEYDDTE